MKKILIVVEGLHSFDRGRPSMVSIDSIGDLSVNAAINTIRGMTYDTILIPEEHDLTTESLDTLTDLVRRETRKIHYY